MAAPLKTAPASTTYTIAYLIAADIADEVTTLLSTYQITSITLSRPGQIPHYVVQSTGAEPPVTPDALSQRELQVLRRMAQGKSNGLIGIELFLSEDTIKTHARTLFKKIGARDRAHAVAIGYQRGILGGDS